MLAEKARWRARTAIAIFKTMCFSHTADSARPFKVSGDLFRPMTGVTAAWTVPRRIHAVVEQRRPLLQRSFT
jgi:hypothetical protein